MTEFLLIRTMYRRKANLKGKYKQFKKALKEYQDAPGEDKRKRIAQRLVRVIISAYIALLTVTKAEEQEPILKELDQLLNEVKERGQ